MRQACASLMLAATVALFGFHARAAEPVAPDAVKFDDGKVGMALTEMAGNPEVGAKVFTDKKLGNCLACHANSNMSKEQFHGEIGPPLDGVGSRYDEGEIRAIVVNSKDVFGDETVMPGFYSLKVGKDVREDLVGKTILTAQQVEDVVAYLMTLKDN